MPTTLPPHYVTLTMAGQEPIETSQWDIEPAPTMRARVEGAMRPNSSWRHTDSHGHEHRWADDVDTVKRLDWADALPTLTAEMLHVDCDGTCPFDDCEGYDKTVYRCAICGDGVEPGFVPDRYRRDVGDLIVIGTPTANLTLAGIHEFPAEPVDCTLRASDGEAWSGKAWATGRRTYRMESGPTTEVRVALLAKLPADVSGP